MRLLSAYIRFAVFPALFSLLSCASSPPGGGIGKDICVLEGEVTVTGVHPFDRRIALADSSGHLWTLKSQRLEGELVNLAGLMIRVKGIASRESVPGPSVFVESYKLLPVSGMVPVTGTIVISREHLLLITDDASECYVLGGPLKGPLIHFEGFKVWVCGESESEEGTDDKGVYILNVKGYGVLGPAYTPIQPVSSDTLRGLDN
ncbi:MAG: hypothetical protein KAX38_09005 [Candidatus Krumholzibacteria bacterium]|nr:hypothetical protein [Candidatus Krumholzibacteria bacterium]